MTAKTNIIKEIEGMTIEQFLQYLKTGFHPLAVFLTTDGGTIVDPSPEKIEKRIKFLKYDLTTLEINLQKAQANVDDLTKRIAERNKILESYK